MTKQLFKDFLKEQDKGITALTKEIVSRGGNISKQAVSQWFCGNKLPLEGSKNRAIVEDIFNIKVFDYLIASKPSKKNLEVLEAKARQVVERLADIKKWQRGEGLVVTNGMIFSLGDDQTITIKNKTN